MTASRDAALSRLAKDVSPSDAEKLLRSLRLKADQKWINHFDEHVWLKPCVVDGVRIGITECCFVESPCPRHAEIGKQE